MGVKENSFFFTKLMFTGQAYVHWMNQNIKMKVVVVLTPVLASARGRKVAERIQRSKFNVLSTWTVQNYQYYTSKVLS